MSTICAPRCRSGRPGATRVARWLAGLLAIAFAAGVGAEPYRQTNPDQVLLKVPSASRFSGNAGSLADALDSAAAQIAYGRRTAQARGFGRAEAILEQWRGRATTSARWHVLLADIHQYRHDYDRALALLGSALALAPGDAQARLMRAAVLQTRGDFATAAKDCRALLVQAEEAIGVACLAHVRSLSGDLERAYELLWQQVARDADGRQHGSLRVWMLTALADMAERRGDPEGAEQLLRAAARLDPEDLFVRLTLADLLLAQARPNEVPGLLANLPRTQGVLLRLAEADHERAGGGEVLLQLRRAVDEATERGERIDGRDRARLALLANEGCEALAAARQNWTVQREPIDVRLLIETAQRCGEPDPLRGLRQWRASTGYQDARADVLLARTGRAF